MIISEIFIKILEKLEVISDDIKYLMLCNENGNKDHEKNISHFKICETLEDLRKLNSSLLEETIFRSTVSTM